MNRSRSPRRCPVSAPGRGPVRSTALVTALITILAVALTITSCGDDDITSPPPENGTGGGIGPAGGAVTAADGGATLTVPAGALTDSLTFTIEALALYPPGAVAQTVYELEPDSATFTVPATLAVNYDPADLPLGTFHAQLSTATLLADNWIPLTASTVDSATHVVSAPLSHLSTYGIIVVGGSGAEVDSLRVYLLDDPDPADPHQFDSLVSALAYLTEQLEYEDLGIVVWQTSTPQNVTSLSFAYDLRLELDDDATGTLVGPGAAPLTINAGGALALSGFTIQNPGGLAVNANRHFALTNSMLPPTTTVNFGGVKSAPFPAADPSYVGKGAAAGRADGAVVGDCQIGNSVSYTFLEGLELTGSYGFTGNTGNAGSIFSATGTAALSFGASMSIGDNDIGEIHVNTRLAGQATLDVYNNPLDRMSVDTDNSGTNNYNFHDNTAATAGMRLNGVGEVAISVQNENIGDGEWEFGVSKAVVNGVDLEYVRLLFAGVEALTGNPDYTINLATTDVQEALTFNFDNTENGKFSAVLDHLTVAGEIGATMRYENTWVLNHVTVELGVDMMTRINATDIRGSYVTVNGNLLVRGPGIAAGAYLKFEHSEVHGDATFGYVSAGATLIIDDSFFYEGLRYGPWFEYAVTGGVADGVARGAAGNGDGTVRLNEVHWSGSGIQHVEIDGAIGPVIITDSDFTHTGPASPTITILDCGGQITVQNNEITGAGLTILDSSGASTITNNQIHVTGGYSAGINLGSSATATATGNTINAAAGVMAAVTISGMDGTTTFSEYSG